MINAQLSSAQYAEKEPVMHNTPPPLQWLSAFEAAARLKSFKKAGVELHVTPSAISQQIKLLEENLGLLLFNRLTRKVDLTEAGQAYFRLAQRTLSMYRSGHQAFVDRFATPIVRLNMVAFVAFDIVIPALHTYQACMIGPELRIETSMSVIDFESDAIDGAIRFGNGQWQGVEVLPLASCAATLVAAPQLLERSPIQRMEDLENHTLIHFRSNHNDWGYVAKFLGQNEIKGKQHLVLDCYLAAMSAAEKGLGVAIGLHPLINNWVTSKRLATIGPAVPIQQQYYFLMRNDEHKRLQMLEIYHWLKSLFDAL